jgi:CHAT domain-containing protein
MSALSKIQQAGFALSLDGDYFEISPSNILTEQQREFLKTHKSEIIQELKQQQTQDKFLYWRIVRKGRAENIHMIPAQTLDEMRHIYRGADMIEATESFHENES